VPGTEFFTIENDQGWVVLRIASPDFTNRLGRARVLALTKAVEELSSEAKLRPLILTGNSKFFSAGADLNEISQLTGPEAYEFALMGQRLMNAVDNYPAPVIASIQGYCMGGGLDLALACDYRISSPNAIFGHRGAALGIMTGWGGTQRLPRLIGKSRALQMFLAAEKIHAEEALKIGLVDAVAPDPLRTALEWVNTPQEPTAKALSLDSASLRSG
jgi:enoyl-CoA hydratase/carnithine racemase